MIKDKKPQEIVPSFSTAAFTKRLLRKHANNSPTK